MDEEGRRQQRGRRFSVFAMLVLVALFTTVLYAGSRSNVQATLKNAVKGAVDTAQETSSDVGQTVVENQPGLYSVSKFTDGDTIDVSMDGRKETVRIIGVDTPETKKPDSPVQCFGQAASDFTRKLIGSSSVRLEADPTNSNRDKYNRLLRYVYLPDGTDVGAEIIKQGYGFAYVLFPFEKMEAYRSYAQEAREQNRGLWSSCQVQDSGSSQHTNNT